MLNGSICIGTVETSQRNVQQTVMGGWIKVYGKKCESLFWQKQQEDLLKLNEIHAVNQSKPIIKAEKMFGRFQICTFQLSISKYVLVRGCLSSYLCLNNAQRTSTIEWMLATDVGKGYEKKTENVLWHKTVKTTGPAILSIFDRFFSNLGILLQRVRPHIASPPEHKLNRS